MPNRNKTTNRLYRLFSVHRFSPFWRLNLIFWLGAVFVGLVAVVLAILSNYADGLFHKLISKWPYIPLVISPLGMAGLTYLTRRYFSGAEGSGIPQCINALRMHEHTERKSLLSLRIMFGKFLCIPAFLCGASLGREGPTVQAAASIMLRMSKYIKFKTYDINRALIMAGGAAGVAAAFNTPLAGVVFAIEELGKSFEHRMSETILTTVLISGFICIMLLGKNPYFGLATNTFMSVQHWYIIPLCGIVGGFLGGCFSSVLVYCVRLIKRRFDKRILWIAAAGGLLIAIIGIASGGTTYGSGYNETNILLHGGNLPLSFAPLKALATIFTYISGIPSGIFAPSLAVGAGIGNIFSHYLHAPNAEALVILTMTAYFCGVTQTPITSFAIIMEMMNRNNMILALMAVALIAKLVSSLVCRDAIYEVLAEIMLERAEVSKLPVKTV